MNLATARESFSQLEEVETRIRSYRQLLNAELVTAQTISEKIVKELQPDYPTTVVKEALTALSVVVGKSSNKGLLLNPHYNAREIVERIKQLREEGYSMAGVANELNKQGIKPCLAQRFSAATVCGIAHKNKINFPHFASK